MRILVIYSLLLISQIAFGQNVFKMGEDNDTIYYDPSNPPHVFKGGVEYAESFSLPASLPKTNLLGYWSSEYGINADSTIYLVDATNTPVDTIKLSGVDFSLASGYIPLKTASTFTMQSINDIDTAFWNHDIYPTTVFQNVDYDSTTYFKVADHVLNADSTELHPARITEIALYSQATDANTYFGVSAIPLGSKWVAKNGNNTTGNGSYVAPYLTIDKATDAVNDGSQVYIKSLFTDLGDTSLHYLYNDRSNKIKGIGYTSIVATSTTYTVRLTAATALQLSSFIINPPSNITGNVITNAKAELSNLLINSYSADVIYNLGGDNIKRNVLLGYSTATGRNIYTTSTGVVNITENLFKVSGGNTGVSSGASIRDYTTSGNVNIKWNDFEGNTSYCIYHAATNGIMNIVGNNFSPDSAKNIICAAGNVGVLKVNGNVFNLIDGGLTSTHLYINAVASLPEITNNHFNNTIGSDNAIVYSYNSQLKARNNLIYSGDDVITTGNDIGCVVNANGSYGLVDISNNGIYSDRIASYHILVGSESTNAGDNDIDSILIESNHINGCDISTNNTHGIMVSFQINPHIRYNKINQSGYGVIKKGTATTVDATGGIYYNVITNTNRGIYVKGGQSVKIYNNTIVQDSTNEYGVYLSNNTGTDTASNCLVKNNIIVSNGTGKNYMVINDGYYNVIDYNVYYCPNGTMRFKYKGLDKTFAEWQALGFDEHSVVINPSFTSATQLWPAISFTGTNLGTDYADGLDISTTWGSSTTLPNVVTKQQGATWQIGAYIK